MLRGENCRQNIFLKAIYLVSYDRSQRLGLHSFHLSIRSSVCLLNQIFQSFFHHDCSWTFIGSTWNNALSQITDESWNFIWSTTASQPLTSSHLASRQGNFFYQPMKSTLPFVWQIAWLRWHLISLIHSSPESENIKMNFDLLIFLLIEKANWFNSMYWMFLDVWEMVADQNS